MLDQKIGDSLPFGNKITDDRLSRQKRTQNTRHDKSREEIKLLPINRWDFRTDLNMNLSLKSTNESAIKAKKKFEAAIRTHFDFRKY